MFRLSSEGLKHSPLHIFFNLVASALDKLNSGQPGFCLNEPTAFTSKTGFFSELILLPIGKVSAVVIKSNHKRICGPLVA